MKNQNGPMTETQELVHRLAATDRSLASQRGATTKAKEERDYWKKRATQAEEALHDSTRREESLERALEKERRERKEEAGSLLRSIASLRGVITKLRRATNGG